MSGIGNGSVDGYANADGESGIYATALAVLIIFVMAGGVAVRCAVPPETRNGEHTTDGRIQPRGEPSLSSRFNSSACARSELRGAGGTPDARCVLCVATSANLSVC